MQIMIALVGFGAGIPKTNLGVGVVNIGYLLFRHGKYDNNVKSLKIIDMISIGQKSGAFIAGGAHTDWFDLDPQNDSWAYNVNWLIGKKVEVELSGLQIIRGEVDVSLKFFDKMHKEHQLVKRCCMKSRGIQFSSITIRGVAQKGTLTSKNIGNR